MFRITIIALRAFFITILVTLHVHAQYDITVMNGITGVQGINDRGQAVGTVNTIDGGRAAIWYKGAVQIICDTESGGWAINNRGQVVGNAVTATGATHAFLWDNGQMTDLGTLGGHSSFALGINDRGQVVGEAAGVDGWYAFLWEDGQMKPLLKDGIANAINNSGQIVGYKTTGGEFDSVFLWENGQIKYLPISYGAAYAINQRGQIVGVYYPSPSESNGFVWEDDTYIDIGPCTECKSVNNRGQIVGELGFLWYKNLRTDLTNLNNGQVYITGAGTLTINDRGQITAEADPIDGGETVWVLLTPKAKN